MRLIETEHACLIKDFFAPGITAGFTKNNLPGNMPDDLFTALGKHLPYAWMKQAHGPLVHEVNREGKYEGDGLLTQGKGFALVVRTADCLPILLSQESNRCEATKGEAGLIGAIHMGWRSGQTGILDNLPADLSGYKAFLGPAMRSCCFEVQDDFLAHRNFSSYIIRRSGRLYFDPVGFAHDNLLARGLRAQDLADCGICTVCAGEGLFSFRKTKTEGRTLNFIIDERNR